MRPGSDGPGRLGARGAAAPSPELCSAAGTSPELVKQALQSLAWTAVWCKRESAARVIYWGSDQGSTGVRAVCATVMAGLGGGERRSTGFGPLEGLQTTLTGQKGSAAGGILTESWDSGASWKRGSPARSSGAGRSGVVTRSKTGGFLRPGPTG